jgi:mRNA interferase MazF
LKAEINRGEVWEVLLDPSKGSEQAGFRPCVIVSPDSMNAQLETLIVLPMTTKHKDWPTRVDTIFDDVAGQVMCEQIRTVSRKRIRKKLGKLNVAQIAEVKLVLKQMLFEN